MRTLVALTAVLGLAAFGCASRDGTPVATSGATATLAASVKGQSPAPRSQNAAVVLAATELRKPGDYVVFRFSGSFRKEPLLLTQKVVKIDGTLVTIDVTLAPEKATAKDASAKTSRVRVLFDRTPGALREVAKVTRIDGDREEPGTLEDYEKIMAETVVVPDRNEETLSSEIVTTNVGDKAIDCKKTSYRVAFGKKTAVMSTLTSDAFVWGDVGGEIKSDAGKVIYRAEVVQLGSGEPASATARR